MRRRLWLAVLVLYAAAGIADGAVRINDLRTAAAQPTVVAALPVAFCTGLFWPLDLAARLVLRG